jgi:murein L,D-transpeptidase YcbB/YkuD
MPVRGPNWHGLLAVLAVVGLQPAALAAAGDIAVESVQPSAHWPQNAVHDLIAVIEDAEKEGLHPSDYGLVELKQALAEGEGARLDARATAAALALAHDYYFGRVVDRSDMQWMIERSPYEALQIPSQLQKAIDDAKLRDFFDALLPSDSRYRALRTELAESPPGPARDRLRVNMERWRWMPRSIASSYLYVNVPSYRLQLVRDGVQLSSYDVIVGARDTPTPQMVSPTGSLVVNPAWYVPPSIVRKSGLRPGRGGYVWKAVGDGSYRVVQPPGPRNALGRIKFNLDNDQAIYLHDTNVKAAFDRENRALSHGCIRVKDIDQLAFELMNRGGDESALDEALASSQTATLTLPQTWPVYIVYFTADTDDSGAVVTYGDPYHYDPKVLAGLDGPPVQIASNQSGT